MTIFAKDVIFVFFICFSYFNQLLHLKLKWIAF